MARQITAEGLELIKSFEGFAPEAYVDPVGVWTIGYGHISGVKSGDTITEEAASQLLENEIVSYENGVASAVKVPLNDNEFSALVSFSYNVGLGALKSSTALKRLNAGDRLGAADALEWWNKGKVNGKLYILPGLVRRRAAEKALFLKPVASDPSKVGQNAGIIPDQKETPNGKDNLAASRTMQGGGVAGAAAAVGAVGAGSQLATKNDQTTSTTAATTTTTTTTTTVPPASSPPVTTTPPPATTTTPPVTTPPPVTTSPATPPTTSPEPGISLPPGVVAPNPSTPSASPSPTPAPSPPAASPPATATRTVPAAPSTAPTPSAAPTTTSTTSVTTPPTTTTSTGATDKAPDLVHKIGSVFDNHPVIYAVVFGVIVLGVIYVLWARLDDWKNGKR